MKDLFEVTIDCPFCLKKSGYKCVMRGDDEFAMVCNTCGCSEIWKKQLPELNSTFNPCDEG